MSAGGAGQYTYSPLPVVNAAATVSAPTQTDQQLAADAALARSLAEGEAALQRERDAVAAAHRAASRARALDDAYYHGGYYYGAWNRPYRPVVVHQHPADDYFLCIFLSSLFIILAFIIVIIVLFAVYDDDDETDDASSSSRRLDTAATVAEFARRMLLPQHDKTE